MVAGWLGLSGCGPRGKLPEEVKLEQDQRKEEKGPDQTVQLKGGQLERSNPGKTEGWTLEWKEAQANFNLDEAKFGGQLKEVSGTIKQAGREVSSFIAREGQVKPGSRKFTLEGGIKLSSEVYDANLECNQLAYDADTGILEASKGIKLNFNGILFPNIVTFRGKADLGDYGSDPRALDSMKDIMKNPLSKILFLGAASAPAMGSVVILQDQNNNIFRVESAGRVLSTLKPQPNGQIRMVLKSESAPIVANWYEKGIEVSAKELNALVTKDKNLISATMTGGISFTMNKGKTDSIHVKAASADYTDSDQKLVVNGALVLDRKGSDGSTIHAEGKGGTILLNRAAAGDKIVKSATINGRLTFKMTGTTVDPETKKSESYYINADAGRLVYNETTNTVVLDENVQISGNNPSLVSSMQGIEKLTITLTDKRDIDTIEMEGTPGKTIFEQKKTGGGGGKRR